MHVPLKVSSPLSTAIQPARKPLNNSFLLINPVHERKEPVYREIKRAPFVVVNVLLHRGLYGDVYRHRNSRRQKRSVTDRVPGRTANLRDSDNSINERYRETALVHKIHKHLEVIWLKRVLFQFLYSPIHEVNTLVELRGHQIGLPLDGTQRPDSRNDAAESDNDERSGGPSRKLCEVERPSLHLASALFFGVGLGSLCIALVMAFCVNYERPLLAAALIVPFIGIAAASPIWWFNYCFLYPYSWGLPPDWLPAKWNQCQNQNRSDFPHGENVSQQVFSFSLIHDRSVFNPASRGGGCSRWQIYVNSARNFSRGLIAVRKTGVMRIPDGVCVDDRSVIVQEFREHGKAN